jgi:hypothetical protein
MIEAMESESPDEERLAQYLELTTADAFELAFEQWYEFRCEVRQCQDTMYVGPYLDTSRTYVYTYVLRIRRLNKRPLTLLC